MSRCFRTGSCINARRSHPFENTFRIFLKVTLDNLRRCDHKRALDDENYGLGMIYHFIGISILIELILHRPQGNNTSKILLIGYLRHPINRCDDPVIKTLELLPGCVVHLPNRPPTFQTLQSICVAHVLLIVLFVI